MGTNSSDFQARRRGKLIALASLGVVLAMLGLSYAAVPLYRMFCAATGYAGTTQVAKSAPDRQGERELIVRFDANVAPGLPWSFVPETPELILRTGQTATIFFKVTNRAEHEMTAQAMYNVSPEVSGAYFDKIACFCFEEKTLAAHESMDMPVVFFLDPALEKDPSMARIDSITLSYTFFASKQTAPVTAAGRNAPRQEQPQL
jgi:cytochrome c oxidase assembly protein subunit 11